MWNANHIGTSAPVPRVTARCPGEAFLYALFIPSSFLFLSLLPIPSLSLLFFFLPPLPQNPLLLTPDLLNCMLQWLLLPCPPR
jgi:hypothetical protein